MNEKVDNVIIKLLKEDPKLKRFQKMALVINEDQDIKNKINEIKNIQKEILNVKHLNKTNAIKALQKQYDGLMVELLEYPLLNTYLDLLNYYNELILTIKGIIESEIEQYFIG